MVRISPFQGDGPGSIPGKGTFLYSSVGRAHDC